MATLHLNFRSDSISRSVYPVAFLPDYNGWNDVKPPYRTLYFLPGYSGGGLETATFTNFAMYSALYGVAIILIDGENSFYLDDDLRGAKFSQYAGKEIVEATRALLPLSHKREDTYIGGISMGGYGAARYAMKYPEYFSAALLLSPAVWENATGTGSVSGWHIFVDENNQFSQEAWAANHPLVYKDSYIAANSPVNFYIVHGDKDTTVLPAAVSAFYEELNEFAPATYVNYAGGTHAWTTWAATARMALEYAGSLLLNAAE